MLAILHASLLSETSVCDSTRQMFQDAACCGGDGLSYCSSERIDMTGVGNKLDSIAANTRKEKTGLKILVGSCGSPVFGGERIVETKIEECLGSPSASKVGRKHTVAQFKNVFQYMSSLAPDYTFMLGDQWYADYVGDCGEDLSWENQPLLPLLWGEVPDYVKEAFQYIERTDDGVSPGPRQLAHIELAEDLAHQGYSGLAEFKELASTTKIVALWDDHEWTNDPGAERPSYLHDKLKRLWFKTFGGSDKTFRVSPHDHQSGIERYWTENLRKKDGSAFKVLFVALDDETYGRAGHDVTFSIDENVYSGVSISEPDPAYIDDWDSWRADRVHLGKEQIDWFVDVLQDNVADLVLVATGGPLWEPDYSYDSLSDFPGEKRYLVEKLREVNVPNLVFVAGDAHSSYVTKVPDILSYPVYTIVGSGLTEGISHNYYQEYYGDISDRFLVAGAFRNGATEVSTFAELDLVLDDDPRIEVSMHMSSDLDGDDFGFLSRLTCPECRYTVRMSELQPQSGFHNRFVAESFAMEYKPTNSVGEDGVVSLDISNAAGETTSFEVPLKEEGVYGFERDKWGAYQYGSQEVVNLVQKIAKASGFVGDEVEWRIRATNNADVQGNFTLRSINNIIHSGSLFKTSTWAYMPDFNWAKESNFLDGKYYGSRTRRLRGYNSTSDTFADSAVQDLYQAYKNEPNKHGEMQAAYLTMIKDGNVPYI